MKTAENVMENLMSYLYSTNHTLLECVMDENYEVAAALRDEIEFYIVNCCKYLIYHKLTKATFDDVFVNLMDMNGQIIDEVSEMLSIPKEKRILI